MLIGNSETNGSESSNNIKDVTSDNFMEEVIELSKTTPVIVDFWAPWCGPCKELGPNIEKAVNNANGKVVLAKVNIDENFSILINNGPGSFSTIRVALSIAKGIKISNKVKLFGFKDSDLPQFNLENIEVLINANLIENKLIKPLYLS